MKMPEESEGKKMAEYNPVITDETIDLLKKGDANAEIMIKNAIAAKDKAIESLENEKNHWRKRFEDALNAHRGVVVIDSIDFSDFAEILLNNGYGITARSIDQKNEKFKIKFEEREDK